ncbi:MAG TPA: ABC transporter substrate-binding protein [Acidimicrobiales bacterium]|nr:ABC transporter substrate-binding protein [Acidimicrobiales bacterium]
MSNPAGDTAPVLVGVLYDFPQADGGALFEEAVRLGLADVADSGRIDRPVELVGRQARGLPAGTAHDVERTFAALADLGVLAVLGPSISDNAMVVTPLADRAGIPCINYTGGEHTRSHWMFHYQVGSLEEEPAVLVEHLRATGRASVAVAHDHSPVGRRYAEFLTEACATAGVEITSSAAVSPLADDLGPVVRRLRASDPEALVYLGLGVAARAVALGVGAEGWDVPVAANSALMFGYARRDWRQGWQDWVYVDTVADDNAVRARLRQRSPRTAAGPIGLAAYDMGRLLGEAIARASHLTRAGVRDALERVKRLPAASGLDATTMGFANFDHGALKGPYLVLRRWHDERSEQIAGA